MLQAASIFSIFVSIKVKLHHCNFFSLRWHSASMASFKTSLLVSIALIGSSVSQSTLIANPEHSAIPTNYPNPYLNPHANNTGWSSQHNESWFNSSVPNSAWTNGTDSNGNFEAAYYPGRAPAVPLAVRSPYTSAWASTANNGSLNSQFPIFW